MVKNSNPLDSIRVLSSTAECGVTPTPTILLTDMAGGVGVYLPSSADGKVILDNLSDAWSCIQSEIANYELNYSCLVYLRSSNRPQILQADVLKTMLHDKNIDAIQRIISPANGSLPNVLFRNRFTSYNNRSKIIHVVTQHEVEWVTTGNIMCQEVRSGKKIESGQLSSNIKQATETLVRHVETSQQLQIDEMEMEFIVDTANNLYVTWINEATGVENNELKQKPKNIKTGKVVELPSISVKNDTMRNSPRTPASKIPISSADPSPREISKDDDADDIRQSWSLFEKAQSVLYGENAAQMSAFVKMNPNMRNLKARPQPTMLSDSTVCGGDFCYFDYEDNGPGSDTQNTSQDTINMIPLKSITLAQKEKREMRNSVSGESVPDDIENRGSVPLASYYQKVPVCTNCFRAYKTLDAAREITKRSSSAHEKKAQSKNRPGGKRSVLDSLESSQNPKANAPLRKYINDVPQLTTIPDQLRLPVDRDQLLVEKSKQLVSSMAKMTDGGVCTREQSRALREKHVGMSSFNDLEGYLRGVPKKKDDSGKSTSEQNQLPSPTSAPEMTLFTNGVEVSDPNRFIGKILVIESNRETIDIVTRILSDEEYAITCTMDVEEGLRLSNENRYNLILMATEHAKMAGTEATKIIRKQEKLKNDASSGRLPIVALTKATSPSDLRTYMQVGMDGCVSKPVDPTSLLNTVRAAIPDHQSSKGPTTKARTTVPLQRTRGLVTSSDVVKQLLPVPANAASGDSDDSMKDGVFQMDADTAFPYLIMGSKVRDSTMFNLIVIQDFFDTYESMQIFFRPLIAKYPGLQILVFNLPGQAFTEWREDCVLNNKYYADCVEALLRHLDYNGTREFETRGPYATPFYCLGFGNGANIAIYHAIQYKPQNLRGLLSLNGFSHIDPHMAGVLHDCQNVFSCSPPSRPDLPVYFFARFLFSAAYLNKVTTPLALNLYTAVHNPITLAGRMQICNGALAHEDLRRHITAGLRYPLVLIQSAHGGLVKPAHVEAFVQAKHGEAKSIRQCLKDRAKPVVIWFESGHELFQECRKPLAELLEQFVTGYHEKHDVAFLPVSQPKDKVAAAASGGGKSEYFEDRFIKNVLGTLDQVRKEGLMEKNPFVESTAMVSSNTGGGVKHQGNAGTNPFFTGDSEQLRRLNESDDPADNINAEKTRWEQFKASTHSTTVNDSRRANNHREKPKAAPKPAPKPVEEITFSFDPTMQNFYGNDVPEDKGKPPARVNPGDVSEVREYMQWRVTRNRKKLNRFIACATRIQRAFRAYLARTLVRRMKEKRAVLRLQARWRAKKAKEELAFRRKQLWACLLLQRNWRGKLGRNMFEDRKKKTEIVMAMQRMFRGKLSRQRVDAIRKTRHNAGVTIQKLVRSYLARCTAWKMRQMRNGAIDIQRVFRGHLGRRRAGLERDKYLFSKAQSQGIDFGRQMLLEHKLHGTRLQSEVSMLSREKAETEEKVEGLLSEIREFDEGVRRLEKEMHELTAIETQTRGILDEEAKMQLREQKMRLDREFGIMLGKIADRKDRLKLLENKLQMLDRTRLAKEEELRDLERKLVVLLEEQQQELEQIKRRQATRGEMILDEASATKLGGGRGGGGGEMIGYSGPTPQQQQQANNMMQSTESLMKFGFMSMSMTYFSSLNMVRAMRKVGAMNTILSGPAATSDPQQLLLQNQMKQNLLGNDPIANEMNFTPKMKPGMIPGDQPLNVSSWTVDDCADWLETLKLGQYRASFVDATIDGAFLFELNDEDLRNTLGIEHNLHRKKILTAIKRLRRLEEDRTASQQRIQNSAPMSALSSPATSVTPSASVAGSIRDAFEDPPPKASVVLSQSKLITLVRHGKLKELQEALESWPLGPFDPSDVQVQYMDGTGTVYVDKVSKRDWHVNKANEHGNTLFIVASQNNKIKIAQFLLTKGANPNHQNNQGQSALHFAMSYNFYDFGAWLNDPSGGGANDTLENMYGLSPYDGLNPE